MIFALLSCTAFEPATASPLASDLPAVELFDGLSRDELVNVDVRGTARSAERVRDDLKRLTPAQRAQTAEALRVLQVTCPFNRASVQLPIALLAAVEAVDHETLDPLVHTDWAMLERGLRAHVAALDTLGADLPLPAEGDFLYGKLDPAAPRTRAQVLAAADPIAETAPLLGGIDVIVETYDDATKATIDANHAILFAATGKRWPMKDHLIAWWNALVKIRPFIEDEALRKRVMEWEFAIARYAGQTC